MATDTQDPPRTMADLNKIIKHDMTPDPSWEQTGEIHRVNDDLISRPGPRLQDGLEALAPPFPSSPFP